MTNKLMFTGAAAQDSVAYVAKRGGPPATESYMWSGYAVTFCAILGYAWLLRVRTRRSQQIRKG
jgi:hypothetical protein